MPEKTTKIALPISILIGALIIGGTIIYTNKPVANEPKEEVTVSKLDYIELAGDLNLNTKQFKKCFQSQEYREEVLSDFQDGVDAGVKSTPTTFVNGRKLVGAYPFSAFEELILEALEDKEIPAVPSQDDDYVLGEDDAPVLIVSFGDFQCPFCGDLYEGAEKEIIEKYVSTGQVKFVYRDFPLQRIHPAAIPAALAAQCAGAQGAYWQYHNALYENQDFLP